MSLCNDCLPNRILNGFTTLSPDCAFYNDTNHHHFKVHSVHLMDSWFNGFRIAAILVEINIASVWKTFIIKMTTIHHLMSFAFYNNEKFTASPSSFEIYKRSSTERYSLYIFQKKTTQSEKTYKQSLAWKKNCNCKISCTYTVHSTQYTHTHLVMLLLFSSNGKIKRTG